jgi:hypothetical protein
MSIFGVGMPSDCEGAFTKREGDTGVGRSISMQPNNRIFIENPLRWTKKIVKSEFNEFTKMERFS